MKKHYSKFNFIFIIFILFFSFATIQCDSFFGGTEVGTPSSIEDGTGSNDDDNVDDSNSDCEEEEQDENGDCPTTSTNSTSFTFSTLAEGLDGSENVDEQNQIIQTEEAFVDLWQSLLPNTEIPNVDFTLYDVVFAVRGIGPYASFEITDQINDSQNQTYRIELTFPAPSCNLTPDNNPYHVIQIPKSNSQTTFDVVEIQETSETTNLCW